MTVKIFIENIRDSYLYHTHNSITCVYKHGREGIKIL